MSVRRGSFPLLRAASAAALALVLSLAGGWPSNADPGGGHGQGRGGGTPHGGPLPGGGGASPGGPIGGGLAGGAGGPTGIGGGPKISGGGGGGDDGAISPLSPNVSGGHDGGRSGPGGGGGIISPLSPGSDGDGRGSGGAQTLNGDSSGGGSGLERRGRDIVDKVGGRDGRDGEDGGDDVARQVTATVNAATVTALTHARQRQAEQMVRAHPDLIETDSYGHPVVRGEILAVAPSPAALARAVGAGYRVRAQESLPDLGVQSVLLMAPRGISAVEALRRIRALDPKGQYDLDHLYQESGSVRGRVAVRNAAAAAAPSVHGVRVGLVDGGVAAHEPALEGVKIVQHGFAPGGPRPSAHGTAVASLIAGRKGVFRGAAPGAALFVADVYGSSPTGGSADAIARALGWLAHVGAPVINISLVGPPNLLLDAAVKGLISRGHIVVAAVGNDGPAAPPLYPASYPGVVAVTGVDARWRVLPEAGRASHVDFAAPGSDMAAAGLDGGFVAVRGTSFAAPIAAGLLARLVQQPDHAAAERAIAVLGREAVDLGPRGPDKLYGRGLVGNAIRTAPGEVRARVALRGP